MTTIQRFWTENTLFDYGIADHIGSSALIVYFALCRHANKKGLCFPSVQLLQLETGLSNKIIAKATQILKQFHLLDIRREKHQHNIYTVKPVIKAIQLNAWKKVSLARVKSTPEQMEEVHQADVDSTPKGITTKEDPIKDTTTEPEIAKPPPESSSEALSFDFALEKLTPEQKQLATKMLKDVDNPQEVLDQFNWCLLENKVKAPLPGFNFLHGLIRRALGIGDSPFIPTHDMAKRRTKHPTQTCRLCDENGLVRLRDAHGHVTHARCIHDEEKMRLINQKKGLVFESSG